MHLCIYLSMFIYDRFRLILLPAVSSPPQTSKGCVSYANYDIYASIYLDIYISVCL